MAGPGSWVLLHGRDDQDEGQNFGFESSFSGFFQIRKVM
jgi:hypothetical protein